MSYSFNNKLGRLNKELKNIGLLGINDYQVLHFINEGFSQLSYLREQTGLQNSHVSKISRMLQKNGYVLSQQSNVNKNMKVLSLTEKGKQLYNLINERIK